VVKYKEMVLLPSGKNGDRPHFLVLCPQVENVLFLTKWGLSPFFPMNDSGRLNLQSRFIPSCVFYPHYLEENRFIKPTVLFKRGLPLFFTFFYLEKKVIFVVLYPLSFFKRSRKYKLLRIESSISREAPK
jgi:hypothetical protein